MPSYEPTNHSTIQYQKPSSLHSKDSAQQLRKPGISFNSPLDDLQHRSQQMQMQHSGYQDHSAGYRYREGQNDAMDIMEGEESPIEGDSGDEVEEALRNGRQYHHHHHHDLQGEQGMDHEGDEGEEEDLEDDSGSFSDSLSSSPSIPDEDIDFNLVYALHTFLATVDGQASVVKGDQLLLLDDSNSYWWLVRVLKTQAIGYIPAENIETPWERLARLNKHRNVDLTSATQQDVVTGPTSSTAQTRFAGRIPPSQQPHPHASQHPTAKGTIASPSHKDHPRNMSPIERAGSSKAKTVLFTAPTYYAHSETGDTEDEYDDEDEGEYEGEMMDHEGAEGEEGVEYEDEEDEEMNENQRRFEEEEEERQRREIAKQTRRDGSEFSEDEGEMEQGTPILEEDRRGAPAAGAAVRRNSLYNTTQQKGIEDDGHLGGDEDEDDQEKQNHWQKEREHAIAAQQQAAIAEAQWAKEREQQARRALSPQNQNQIQPQSVRSPQDGTLSTSTSSSSVRRAIDENDFVSNVPTKKLTATPSIVRDPTFDFDNPHAEPSPTSPVRSSDSIKSASPTGFPNRVRGVEIVDPRDPKFNRMLQPTLKAGEETLYEHVSRRSVDSGHQQPGGGPSNEGDLSLASMDTATTVSSIVSNGSSNEGAGPATLTKKQKRQSGENGDGDKKRKSGGILGLFRKKDKKNKKGGKEEIEGTEPRSSEDSARRTGSASPSESRNSAERAQGPQAAAGGGGGSKRDSVTAESMFSTDAALRQQELEAKQALYHQYGVHRNPGDITNTMAPRPAPVSVSMTNSTSRNSLQLLSPTSASNGPGSPSYNSAGQRIRPGSLMGSPSIPGLEVPLLSVLRVFAGEQVEAEATFKTVLLNQSTTAADLVKQAMQRFRLTGYELTEEFFLTVKELGGEERPLKDDECPLAIFEELSEKAGADSTFAVPSVKRSSVGSINSISSNLSLNPAITRLGMNDWSDGSAVKFYLNRRLPSSASDSAPLDESTGRTSFSERESISADSITTSTLGPNSSSQTSYRFAVRLLIHPSDLPENVVFDPQSNAIIPKHVLQERQQRNHGSNQDASNEISPNAREKIVFFPKNVNVSDVIEAGLDRFGIVDGVVDGGDEVEDRVSRRRSVTRVKYSLAADRDGRETVLNASTKLLDAYSTAPAFKSYDRSSKEFKRRSVDATLILGSSDDVQPSDPIFIIRRSAHRGSSKGAFSNGPLPAKIDELDELQQQRARGGGDDHDSGPKSQREIIAAQRAASRANQRAILSAQKNSDQGIDINIPDQGTIRSSRGEDDDVRYSFINHDGTETDISDIVENEWRSAQGQQSQQLRQGPSAAQLGVQSTSMSRPGSRASSKYTPGANTDADSFQTAPTTPRDEKRTMALDDEKEEEDDDQAAISALSNSQIDVDLAGTGPYRRLKNAPSSSSLRQKEISASNSPTPGPDGGDILQDALGPRPVTSPVFNESLQERLDRVLSKVKEDKIRRAASPSGSPGRPRSYIGGGGAGSATPSGRASPAVGGLSGRLSPLNSSGSNDRRSPPSVHTGRLSPLGGRDSPTIDQLINQSPRSQSNQSRQGQHGKNASVSSVLSSGTDQPSTPITAGSSSSIGRAPSGASFTPASSATSNHRRAVVYPADFGFDTLLAIVNAAEDSRPSTSRNSAPRDPAREALFGRDLNDLDVAPEVRQLYEPRFKVLNELESRLDALLLRIQSPSPSRQQQPLQA
ncbi:uncharacterized protein JCM6883_005493 [Sporobolomyces salmoneus]|uniref:uncharacterized protein n=1 Tax=Sporobolomyces salmoneus TaxID=183962 RepID=UPI00317713E9